MKIDKFINDFIWEVIKWTGTVLSLPIIGLHLILKWPIMKEKDIFDRWTFAHVLASYMVAHLTYLLTNSFKFSLLAVFLVMYVGWELIIDGNKLSDPEGFSVADIGADFIGYLLFVILTSLGG